MLTAPIACALAVTALSPRSSTAISQRQQAERPPGIAIDLVGSATARPERSKGGTDLLLQLGLRGAYLHQLSGRSGPAVGGELALRTFAPQDGGNASVGIDIVQLSSQAGAIAGYRLGLPHIGLTPHLSAGLTNDFLLLHYTTPADDRWRPRWVPGVYLGGGLIGSLYAAMLRLDVAVGVADGRPTYRFDTGIGVCF
ncbi:MAG: hypothetical protein JXR83_08460 [Deltaproteobacteria bacterium]|nr:hypothetical protein [Deltaproteobacteria bacterium]